MFLLRKYELSPIAQSVTLTLYQTTKLKPFADDKIKVRKIMIFDFDRVDNIVDRVPSGK